MEGTVSKFVGFVLGQLFSVATKSFKVRWSRIW